MYQMRCAGCGKSFEALKANRKWCSDLCGKRSRRQAARVADYVASTAIPAADRAVNSDTGADATDIMFVRQQLAFARAVQPGLMLPLDLLDGLLSADGYGDAASEADYDVVQRVLVSSAVARLEALQSGTSSVDDVLAGLKLLTNFLGDLVSPGIVAALAAAL